MLDAGRLASASNDHTVKIWDIAEARCVATLEGHRDRVYALAVLDAGRLVSASHDRTVKIWDVAAARCVATLEGHSGGVHALAVLDAGRLASGSSDNTVKIWSAEGKANDEANESSKSNRNVSQADATATNESSMGNRK